MQIHTGYKKSLSVFTCYQNCLSYLASAETVHDLLLPAKTAGNDKRLPAGPVRMILLPADTLSRKHNHPDSLRSKPVFVNKVSAVNQFL